MAQTQWRILTASDADVLKAFERLWKAWGGGDATWTANLVTQGAIQTPTGKMGAFDTSAVAQRLQKSRTPVARTLVLQLSANGLHLSVDRNPDGLDTVVLGMPDNLDALRATEIVAAAHETFRSFQGTPGLDKTLGPELAEFYRRREEGLQRLESMARELVEQDAVRRAEMSRQLDEERKRLHAEIEEQRAEVLRERARYQAEVEERHKKLDERAADLDEQDNRSARRKIRADLKKVIENRNTKFELTESTKQKRLPVLAAFLALLLVTGGYAITLVVALLRSPDATIDWPHVVRAVAALGGFAASLVFFIRWQDAWARKHAEEEFKLKRLELDIDRASWVVEMSMEWNDARNATIPSTLLERLTRNLFVEHGGSDGVRHPTEELIATLLGASARARVKTGLGELELDRRGLRRLAQSAKEEDSNGDM